MNVSIHSTSNKPSQKPNISTLKRNGSPLIHIGSSTVKKHITSVDVAASRVSFQMLYLFFVRNKKY